MPTTEPNFTNIAPHERSERRQTQGSSARFEFVTALWPDVTLFIRDDAKN
jgi:hypothetical protein